MKIYTKTGDKGTTSLFDGERIEKHHQRVEAYGHMDELNSALGMLVAFISEDLAPLRNNITTIQRQLFDMASWLATTPDSAATGKLNEIPSESIERLEHDIDRMQSEMDILDGFIIPGGCQAAAWAHVVRTICRRTERRITAIMPIQGVEKSGKQSSLILKFINRLSDYLYTLARYINLKSGIPDIKK